MDASWVAETAAEMKALSILVVTGADDVSTPAVNVVSAVISLKHSGEEEATTDMRDGEAEAFADEGGGDEANTLSGRTQALGGLDTATPA